MSYYSEYEFRISERSSLPSEALNCSRRRTNCISRRIGGFNLLLSQRGIARISFEIASEFRTDHVSVFGYVLYILHHSLFKSTFMTRVSTETRCHGFEFSPPKMCTEWQMSKWIFYLTYSRLVKYWNSEWMCVASLSCIGSGGSTCHGNGSTCCSFFMRPLDFGFGVLVETTKWERDVT